MLKKVLCITALAAAGVSSTSAFASSPVSFNAVSVGAQLNFLTAPDAVSRAILVSPIGSLHEGASSAADIPAAVHRNYPKIVEQNLARMSPLDATSWVDQLSDTELKAIA